MFWRNVCVQVLIYYNTEFKYNREVYWSFFYLSCFQEHRNKKNDFTQIISHKRPSVDFLI